MICAILFSNPSSRSLLNGKLFGSAAICRIGRSPANAGAQASRMRHESENVRRWEGARERSHLFTLSPCHFRSTSRKAEDIKRASLGGVLGQLADRIHEAERGAGVSNV